MKITMKRLLLIILTMAAFTPLKAQNDYKIITGQFEKGAPQVQEAFAQLFGEDGTKEKFDFYFHWYNIPHEFGHCILDFYGRSVGKVREEMLANRFAVAYWKSAGYSKELAELKEMLESILETFPDPVPEGRSFEEYFTEIWGSDELIKVSVYGYLQFKGVLIAMEEGESLEEWLAGEGIDGFQAPQDWKPVAYSIGAESAELYLEDLQKYLRASGVSIPSAVVELCDAPSTHCARKVQ